MKKKLYIFDLDGTLVNAYPAIIQSFSFTLKKLGIAAVQPNVIIGSVGWGDVNLLKPFVPASMLERAMRIYRRHHSSSLKRYVKFMPYAEKFLYYLKAEGCKLAIATNRPTRFTRIILRKLKILSIFDEVLCADKLPFGKPNPIILNKLVKDLALDKSLAVYVGDMALDVETGKRAGIDTIAIATGSSSLHELEKKRPKHLFKSFKEFLKYCRDGKLV